MVELDVRRRGIADLRLLAAMRHVPRHFFVPEPLRGQAYADYPLPIGEAQTISQPYIVALMTEALSLTGSERVLEIGTGSGYQTALLAELANVVWTIERTPTLQRAAAERLSALGYRNVRFVVGDGTLGLPEHAPFDRILATGSLPAAPDVLLDQLAGGGVFVGPVGGMDEQELVRIDVGPPRRRRDLGAVRFVPLVGAAGWD